MEGKNLIVYYSYTGHTKMIAEKLERKLGCDIIELKPTVQYSTDYDQVVNDEQNSEASNHFPEIEEINIDLKSYDKIMVGFPTWWYRPCPVVRSFLKKYDLSGKIIIPFATNAGWLGRSFEEVKKLCPNSKVENEMNIVFTTNYKENKLKTLEQEIDKWMEKIKE